uniref:Uncharacterized protein n=1 Tax=Hyaloperonospora arabidopsidis (strain Emoy2) TaxID=559515 RepID=M4C2E0_HYAAE
MTRAVKSEVVSCPMPCTRLSDPILTPLPYLPRQSRAHTIWRPTGVCSQVLWFWKTLHSPISLQSFRKKFLYMQHCWRKSNGRV